MFYLLSFSVIQSTGLYYDAGSDDKTEAPAAVPIAAVIDSGTSLVRSFCVRLSRATNASSLILPQFYTPTASAKAFYSQIPGAKPAPEDVGVGFYTYPCDAKLGTISVGFGSKKYAVDPADFALGQVAECVHVRWWCFPNF